MRKDFFYDRPLGLLVNLAVSGASMWPPVWRDERRGEPNPVGMEQLAAVLIRGAVVGIHPEGRRGRGPDPYTLLPLRPGLGRLLQLAHPDVTVLPYFTLGTRHSVPRFIRRNAAPPGQRGEPVRIRFGAPMRAGDVVRGRDPMAATEAVMDVVRALAEQDRVARADNPRML